MKKLSAILLFALVIALLLPACKKYPEGPTLSCRSKTSRLVNQWKIDKVLENGYDVTVAYKETMTNLVFDIQENGDIVSTFLNAADSSITYTSKWEFTSDKSGITITTGVTSSLWDILMLKNDELWLKQTLTAGIITSTEEIHYVTN